MVRHYKAQKRHSKPAEMAIQAVTSGRMSYREAALNFGMSAATLFRAVRGRPAQHQNRIFTDEEELLIAGYLLKCSSIGFGLTRNQTRQFLFDYSVSVRKADAQRKFPGAWEKKKLAGIDFLYLFLARHPELALRKPEPTSIARAIGFNRPAIMLFYDNLRTVKSDNYFPPERIFNLDETGLQTVVPPPRVFAHRGSKQVSQITSAERGTLVTFVGIICAKSDGEQVPPVFVIPRKRVRDNYLLDAPEGSIAFGSPNGWMTADIFVEVLKHLKVHTGASVDSKILLLLDNHESHVSLKAIEFCVENGIVLLSFPPHTSHRLQPLDVAVYGPFKSSFSTAQNDLLAEKAGQPITIYDIPKMARIAYDAAFTESNILSAFKKTGIVPLNSQIFTDAEFALGFVSDQPPPQDEFDDMINGDSAEVEDGDFVNDTDFTEPDIKIFRRSGATATSGAKKILPPPAKKKRELTEAESDEVDAVASTTGPLKRESPLPVVKIIRRTSKSNMPNIANPCKMLPPPAMRKPKKKRRELTGAVSGDTDAVATTTGPLKRESPLPVVKTIRRSRRTSKSNMPNIANPCKMLPPPAMRKPKKKRRELTGAVSGDTDAVATTTGPLKRESPLPVVKTIRRSRRTSKSNMPNIANPCKMLPPPAMCKPKKKRRELTGAVSGDTDAVATTTGPLKKSESPMDQNQRKIMPPPDPIVGLSVKREPLLPVLPENVWGLPKAKLRAKRGSRVAKKSTIYTDPKVVDKLKEKKKTK